jgi:hypothetical protein
MPAPLGVYQRQFFRLGEKLADESAASLADFPVDSVKASLLSRGAVVDILFSCLVDLFWSEENSGFHFGCPAGTDSKKQRGSTSDVRQIHDKNYIKVAKGIVESLQGPSNPFYEMLNSFH